MNCLLILFLRIDPTSKEGGLRLYSGHRKVSFRMGMWCMGIPVQTFRQSGDSLQKGLDRADVVAEQGSAGEGLPSSK